MYLTKPSVKQRYNWGYHDGKNAGERGHRFRPAGILKPSTAKHFDAKYQEGYEAGYWPAHDERRKQHDERRKQHD